MPKIGNCLSICLEITYLLTPRCRVLLGLQLVKKFPAFHGTRRFITARTSVRHPSLSWVSPIQSIYPHPTSWRSILILSTHLRLGLRSFYLEITNKIRIDSIQQVHAHFSSQTFVFDVLIVAGTNPESMQFKQNVLFLIL